MIKRNLSEIAQMIDGSVAELFGEVVISGVATHPKDVQSGNLYIPLTPMHDDGNDHILRAVRRGASALIWGDNQGAAYPGLLPSVRVEDTRQALLKLAEAYRKELPVRTIVVTGSHGKTTACDLLTAVLATTYQVHRGSSSDKDPLIALACSILAMKAADEMAVYELHWSAETDIRQQSMLLKPEAAIITNIAEKHLLQLESRENIAAAFSQVSKGIINGGLLVYNGDDALLEQHLQATEDTTRLLTFRFGTDRSNGLFPIATMIESEGTSFKTNLPTGSFFRIPMLGYYNIMNSLGAIVVSKYMGVCEDDVIEGMKQQGHNPASLTAVKTKSGAVILNDSHNATPTSMKAAIMLLKDLSGYNRKIAVLGDMAELGSDEVEHHKEIGSLLSEPDIDRVFTYGTLARHIASEAGKGQPAGKAIAFQEKADLIQTVAAEARERDLILVKGSSMMGLDELVRVLARV